MPVQPREAVIDLGVGEHGGMDYAELEELGVSPDEVIDFSVVSNPLGTAPGLPPCNVNAAAQQVGVVAWCQGGFLRESRSNGSEDL